MKSSLPGAGTPYSMLIAATAFCLEEGGPLGIRLPSIQEPVCGVMG
jgi:hypothetical protein